MAADPKPPTRIAADPNLFFGCYLAGLSTNPMMSSTAMLENSKTAWATFAELVDWVNDGRAEVELKKRRDIEAATQKRIADDVAACAAAEATKKAAREAAWAAK